MKIFSSLFFIILVLNLQADTNAKSKFKLAKDGKKIYKSTLKKFASNMKEIKVYYPEEEALKENAKTKLKSKEKSVKKEFVSADKIKKVDIKKEDINTQENPTTFFENLNKADAKTINIE